MFNIKKNKKKIDEKSLLELLGNIKHPAKGRDIVSLGMVQGLKLNGDHVTFALEIVPAEANEMEALRRQADEALLALDGVNRVTSVLTAERPAGSDQPAAKPNAAPKSPMPHGASSGPAKKVPGVKHVIAVASGKGGVGKSTTSVNLALALGALGLKAGVFDIDIYGPSIPRLLGTEDTRPESLGDGKITPVFSHGLATMSIGYLLEKDTATIWRGPMVMGAIQQMLRDVKWDLDGELDVLVVDLPPGTGDAQLTLVQTVELDGAVIVSTPQDIALIDARKGLDMFNKTNTKVLGLIENMSYFLCPSCGERSDIFGHGGARETAAEKGITFLGEIPLHMDIRESSDAGTPIVVKDPESPHAQAYLEIARKIMEQLP
ncbi:Mrp/NBP35 family ATP-binding protein [Emcibacter nanhaiensis]|uniref:Iron-sulfur cluster carrier protein n=1 Tax=Emcibacter nanhaiensis TaxID=1505037 RepID=A0A501PBL2_9PROT|nr:Mrp/NBP35 family ATP-binding protein [Emcibacter nanhaiensis]TPD57588.1 Mrp/NBP35 family ATP-binding protein [Emcibacter nanhaiensis]